MCLTFLRRTSLLATGCLTVFAGAPAPAAGEAPAGRRVDCRPVLERMRADFAREPGRLILGLEDALTTSEVCAGPIVRTAVNFAGGDAALTAQIVIAAIRMVPAAAAQITECALLESPDAAPVIRAALSKEIGEDAAAWLDSAPAKTDDRSGSAAASDGKAAAGPVPAGKIPLIAAPAGGSPGDGKTGGEGLEFWGSVGISGIYLAIPDQNPGPQKTAGSSKPRKITIITRKWLPNRPVLPVTRSIPE